MNTQTNQIQEIAESLNCSPDYVRSRLIDYSLNGLASGELNLGDPQPPVKQVQKWQKWNAKQKK